MAADPEVLRLECLKQAVLVWMDGPLADRGGQVTIIPLAKEFATFVLDEGTEGDEDDSELKPQVRAFNDEGQEL
jgi:hypothetical protein